jgi:thiamine-phosphate pyrophosphorylase
VNDRADVARLARAAGVHVGQTDLSPLDVRSVIGPGAIVGLSTHTAEQAAAAAREPIDYLAVGPVFATATKARPDPIVGFDGVRAVAAMLETSALPVVAIGGITRERARAVLDSGAAAVAVISDLLQDDPGQAARELLAVVE